MPPQPSFLNDTGADEARMPRHSGEKVGLVKQIGSAAGTENMLLKI